LRTIVARVTREIAGAKAIGLILIGFTWATCIGCETTVLHFNSSDQGQEQGGSTAAPGPPPAHELRVERDLNLSLENTGSRNCLNGGDIVTYSVSSLEGATATLSTQPGDTCLESGDEVLLIQLQGTATDIDRVGQHELLRVASVAGTRLQFVSPPLGQYGPAAEMGWLNWNGRVAIQRVPQYSRLVVTEGATLSAAGFQDEFSGVLALRVLGNAQVDGRIAMNGKGYRGGAPRELALQGGLQGESIAGPGAQSTTGNHGGGGGGLGDQTTSDCVQDGNPGGGGGHLESGGDAVVNDLCGGAGRGRGGNAYAVSGRLFLGSGGGSGGVDNIREDNPPGAQGGHGGGIIWILAQSVSGVGSIESRGLDGVGDVPELECEAGGSTTSCYDHSGPGGGGAGGSIRLSVEHQTNVLLDVSGGLGGNGFDTASGNGGPGAPGVLSGF
jgi:large repetitive protein